MPTPAVTHIVPLILDRIRDHLETVMITNVTVSDVTRVDEIKIGRYQQNPSAARRRISVMHGDLEDANYVDGILPRVVRNNPIGFNMEARELGGTEYWYRRGIVEVECFFTNLGLSEEQARDRAYAILGRVESNLQSMDLNGLVDTYNERAGQMFASASSMIQSGGPPSSWVFRGKVYWDCLTVRNPYPLEQ